MQTTAQRAWLPTVIEPWARCWQSPGPHLLIGERAVARALIGWWVARGEQDPVDSYERVWRESHPLVCWQRVATIEDVRTARRQILQAGRDVLVLDGLAGCSEAAQGVLLRVLEADAERVFILAPLHLQQNLLPTIHSRSRQWVLPDVPDDVLVELVGSDEPADRVLDALALARGDIDRARQWLVEVEAPGLLGGWRKGPRRALVRVLNADVDLSLVALDMVQAMLRWYLVTASRQDRVQPILRRWPAANRSRVYRVWLVDQLLLVTAGWYGQIDSGGQTPGKK